jgi:glutamate-1-semialdehyde aminotransferase
VLPELDRAARFATKAEACDVAIELARSFTGRTTVIVVPGPYNRATLPWLCKEMAESSERIAAIVVDLDGGDEVIYGRLLKKARELASAEGALLIWCETVADRSAFQGGRQAVYRIKADLTCLTVPDDASWLSGKAEVLDHAISI